MASEDRYRLAPLRDVRTRDEKTRKGELASAVGDARETQAKLDAARARTQAARAVLDVALTTRDTELAHDARLDHIDVARGTLARARADREVIERHFARWRDDQRKLRERRDD